MLLALPWPISIGRFALGLPAALLVVVFVAGRHRHRAVPIWWETALAERMPPHVLSRVTAYDWMVCSRSCRSATCSRGRSARRSAPSRCWRAAARWRSRRCARRARARRGVARTAAARPRDELADSPPLGRGRPPSRRSQRAGRRIAKSQGDGEHAGARAARRASAISGPVAEGGAGLVRSSLGERRARSRPAGDRAEVDLERAVAPSGPTAASRVRAAHPRGRSPAGATRRARPVRTSCGRQVGCGSSVQARRGEAPPAACDSSPEPRRAPADRRVGGSPASTSNAADPGRRGRLRPRPGPRSSAAATPVPASVAGDGIFAAGVCSVRGRRRRRAAARAGASGGSLRDARADSSSTPAAEVTTRSVLRRPPAGKPP